MKKRNVFFAIMLIVMVSLCFTTCENPIIKRWWGDPDPDYISILKTVPVIEIIYEEIEKIVEIYLPPEKQLQTIKIINIEYVLFSGDQSGYNMNSVSGTSLSPEERKSNELNIEGMAEALEANQGKVRGVLGDGDADDPEYMIILHGHANPVTFEQGDIGDLMELSKNRAYQVAVRLNQIYTGSPYNPDPPASSGPLVVPDPPLSGIDPELEGRVSVTWYGGERNLGSSSYAGLNRRVEMILIEILTETIAP